MAYKKYNIVYFREYAKQRNGQCLSEEYTGYTDKLKFRCDKGHVFETQARCIILGHWCPQCGIDKQRHNHDEIANIIEEKGGTLLSQYKNNKEKIKILCNKCDNIWLVSYGHIKSGRWCPECKKVKIANIHRKYSIDFVQLYIDKYNGVCLSKKYYNTYTKLKFKCSEGHVFYMTFGNIKYNNHWCPYCSNNTSNSEQVFRKVMEDAFNVEFPKKRPKWLINKEGNRLELDGYNKELGIAFEYQGRQHFEIVTAFKGTKAILDKTQEHDQIKKELCAKNNITLLCPTYKMKPEDFESYITDNIG